MWDVYVAADKHHEVIVGGGGKTVGIGGYITGGGHSIFAPKYGLAADNVWEMEIVTPGGDIIIANEDRHQDLFWAMRGVSSSCPQDDGRLNTNEHGREAAQPLVSSHPSRLRRIQAPRLWASRL